VQAVDLADRLPVLPVISMGGVYAWIVQAELVAQMDEARPVNHLLAVDLVDLVP
jgi:hypothetical protein